jgi:hypothetical protein
MNEEERWKEKKENEARADARKKELKSRPAPPYKTYEITLKNAGQPGLPPPTNTFAKVTTAPHGKTTRIEGNTEKTDATVKGDDSKTATAPDAVAKDDEESKEDDTTPGVDISLEESRKILQDLIGLTSKDDAIARSVSTGK